MLNWSWASERMKMWHLTFSDPDTFLLIVSWTPSFALTDLNPLLSRYRLSYSWDWWKEKSVSSIKVCCIHHAVFLTKSSEDLFPHISCIQSLAVNLIWDSIDNHFTSVMSGLNAFSLTLAPATYGSYNRRRCPFTDFLGTLMLLLMIVSDPLSTEVLLKHRWQVQAWAWKEAHHKELLRRRLRDPLGSFDPMESYICSDKQHWTYSHFQLLISSYLQHFIWYSKDQQAEYLLWTCSPSHSQSRRGPQRAPIERNHQCPGRFLLRISWSTCQKELLQQRSWYNCLCDH